MVARFLMFLLIFSPFTAVLQGVPLISKIHNVFSPEPAPPPPSMKVLLVNDHNGVILEVKGKYKIYDARNMQLIGTRYLGKRKFLQADHAGMVWGEEFPGVHQIAIVPDDIKTTIIVDGVEYAGSVYAYDVGGTISVVNHVDIEKYLETILPSEYRTSFPEEVLNAVAIAARTNAYYQAQNSKSPFWDVEASKVGYHGVTLSKKSNELSKAIDDTRYMILNRIGKDKWLVTPFPAHWRPLNGGKIVAKGEYSKITLEEAAKMAEKGKDASQILQAAFPDTDIELVHYS
jgi:stage II sporulation protein D